MVLQSYAACKFILTNIPSISQRLAHVNNSLESGADEGFKVRVVTPFVWTMHCQNHAHGAEQTLLGGHSLRVHDVSWKLCDNFLAGVLLYSSPCFNL